MLLTLFVEPSRDVEWLIEHSNAMTHILLTILSYFQTTFGLSTKKIVEMCFSPQCLYTLDKSIKKSMAENNIDINAPY